MTNPQRILIAAVFVVAVLGGGWLALTILGGGGGSGASPSPVAVASAGSSATPSGGSPAVSPPSSEAPSSGAEPSASVAPSSSAAPSPSAVPSAVPSAAPRPTPVPGEPATVLFTNLKLDAKDDPAGANRRLTFESAGAGSVKVALTALTPQGNAIVCLSADGVRLACKTTANGSITANTTKKHASFVVTVRGEGIATPAVELRLTFPAKDPAVTITNARFDGTASPETNGIIVLVQPRRDGDVAIEADWGGHPFLYEVDLFEQGGPGSQVLPNQGPATRVSERLPVTGHNGWKLVLQNIELGFGATPMTATVAWP